MTQDDPNRQEALKKPWDYPFYFYVFIFFLSVHICATSNPGMNGFMNLLIPSLDIVTCFCKAFF